MSSFRSLVTFSFIWPPLPTSIPFLSLSDHPSLSCSVYISLSLFIFSPSSQLILLLPSISHCSFPSPGTSSSFPTSVCWPSLSSPSCLRLSRQQILVSPWGAEHPHPGISLLVATTTSRAKLFIASDQHDSHTIQSVCGPILFHICVFVWTVVRPIFHGDM